eukprot:12421357-Karenia_brevis.AAC.1
MVSLPSLTAPGPTGERPEHLRDCLSMHHVSGRRRLLRALDALTVQWAAGSVTNEARWLLNTSLTWLKKGAEVHLPEDDAVWLSDVLENLLQDGDSDAEMDPKENDPILNASAPSGRPKVRPIQMGEFLRKWMTRRLLAIQKIPIQCAMTAARQWGVGTPGGAEAIIYAHHGIEELFFEGKLPSALAVIQVDQNNMFGNLDWESIRASMLAE